jgi:flagellar biosynthetic protein FliO
MTVSEPAFAIGELVKLVFALGVTIGLFYALALFMKRMQVGTGRSGTLITVLAALPLGGKEKIWVLDIAGEKLVVGSSPGNVNCLHILTKTDLLDQAAVVTPKPRIVSDFAALLRGVGGTGEKQ